MTWKGITPETRREGQDEYAASRVIEGMRRNRARDVDRPWKATWPGLLRKRLSPRVMAMRKSTQIRASQCVPAPMENSGGPPSKARNHSHSFLGPPGAALVLPADTQRARVAVAVKPLCGLI
ncbi:hypothetical protein WOLCODRAFT_155224 [Wolfiporia cocos MD-104 SS10]|uniref:Uncharacterized protein n=1 Tax=Wolfiporia cocos (strain MD-104) TaxID=742152 RepID=A0A2H3J457_WOLCO|nr:hypothetical protein WOLCODRAFT_155224 [Wolfiporia cocos MD-104 SS10]